MFIKRLIEKTKEKELLPFVQPDEDKTTEYDWAPDEDDDEWEIQLCEALESVVPYRRTA